MCGNYLKIQYNPLTNISSCDNIHHESRKEVITMEKIFCSTKDKEIEYTSNFANTSNLEAESKEPLRRVCKDKDMDCLGKKCPLNRLNIM